MMKVLILADEEVKSLGEYYDPEKTRGVDLIISCGDLNHKYLEFLETMVNCPLLYVKGNHDKSYLSAPPEGCIDIDDRIYDYKGLRVLGLGGSMRYHPTNPCMYTEEEMRQRIRKLNRMIALHNGFDILVTHSPARGYGDMDDLPHMGFACFNSLLTKWKPKYMFYGHVHANYQCGKFQRECAHPSGTRIINAYESHIVEIGEDEHPAHGKTGSALYDLYVSITSRRRHSF